MRQFMAVVKALADENRVRALMAVRGRELCVCQIIELLQLAPSTVSKHMSILRQARLVDSRKEGRWIYYRLAGPDAPGEAREAIAWLTKTLTRNPRIEQDGACLLQILEIEPVTLCQRQSIGVHRGAQTVRSDDR